MNATNSQLAHRYCYDNAALTLMNTALTACEWLRSRPDLGFFNGGCPIHLKGALEVERRRRRGGRVSGGGCTSSAENVCVLRSQWWVFYAFPVIFTDTVTANAMFWKYMYVLFEKGHPNQKGGCPDTLDTPLDPPLQMSHKVVQITPRPISLFLTV